MKIVFASLCIVLFSLPFSKVTPSFEIIIVTFNSYTIGILFLAFCALLYDMSPAGNYRFSLVELFMIVFCCTYFVTTILSKTMITSGRLAFHAVFIPVVSFFAIKSLITSDSEFKKALAVFIGSIALFAVIGTVEVGLNESRGKILEILPIGVSTMAVFAVCNLMYSGWWKKYLGLIAFPLTFFLLVITYSRAYIVGIIISPIIYGIIRRGYAIVILSLLIFTTFLFTIFLTANSSYFKPESDDRRKAKTSARVSDIQSWKQSFYDRAQAFEASYKRFKKNFFFGTGLRTGDNKTTVHNFHLEWLEYGGIFGYLVCLSIFFSYFGLNASLAKKDAFAASNLCVVTLILLNSFTNGIMHGLMPYFIFVAIGFSEARRKIVYSENSEVT